MFPTVLRARVESFIGAERGYSKLHQRRLRTDVSDWAKTISFSLQHAAEQMTPAILSGYDRWRSAGLRCAAIEKADMSRPICSNYLRAGEDNKCPGEVPGFLIFGLSKEALKCFDYMLCNQKLEELYKKGSGTDNFSFQSGSFKRIRVHVEIGIKGGGSTSTEGVT
jgi:hypothetical protein